MAYDINAIIASLQQKEAQAYAANLARKEQVEGIYDAIIERYGAGGTFGTGFEAELEQAKTSAVGGAIQRDISRGLYGVTPYEATWEKEIGTPARLKLEDIKMEKLTSAEMAKAGFLERIEEPYPDYGLTASLAAQAAQMPSRTYTDVFPKTTYPSTYGGYNAPTYAAPTTGQGGVYGSTAYSPTYGQTMAPTATAQPTAQPTKTSQEYQDYLAQLQTTQGFQVATATPSEYEQIQKKLKTMYGSSQYGY